jgi:hypothetical protein
MDGEKMTGQQTTPSPGSRPRRIPRRRPNAQKAYLKATRPCFEGQTMASEAQRQVVIIYEYALLGEGIASYVLAQTGVDATVARAHDLEAVKSALALAPAVVIFELSEALEQGDLATLAPNAVLIDVSSTMTVGLVGSPCAVGLERIRQTVCGIGSTLSRTA